MSKWFNMQPTGESWPGELKDNLPRLGPLLGRGSQLESLRLAMDDNPIFLDPDIGRVPDPGTPHTS